MAIMLDYETESKLREVLGQELDQIAGPAIIAEAYQTARPSIGQAARLLGLSINDAYGFMKERGIPVNYTLQDFEADCESLSCTPRKSISGGYNGLKHWESGYDS